jgi:hypothetical protein
MGASLAGRLGHLLSVGVNAPMRLVHTGEILVCSTVNK